VIAVSSSLVCFCCFEAESYPAFTYRLHEMKTPSCC